jgi:transcriptional regulator GlxA family with amidase domain
MVVLLMENVLPLDFAIPMHVFAREAPEFYDVVTCSIGGGPVSVAGGMQIVPDGDVDLLRGAETVVVPGWANAAATRVDPVALDELRRASQAGARMVSICSGTFALAQAGLLGGQFPDVEIDRESYFVDNGSVLTSGGVTAGVDLALHMLRADLGPAVAQHVARRLVAAPQREGGQAQFVETAPIPPEDDELAAAQQWMLRELGRPITVADMAAHIHLSPRAFHRLFRARTGTSPLSWLQERRIERARELLENSSESIAEISERTGFGTPANLRAQFRRAVGVSPASYRSRFRVRPAA